MAKRSKRLIVVRFRRDRGMWEVDYRDQHGRRRRPLFPTEADALENAAKRREGLEKAAPLDETNFTLREYAAQWLNAVRLELEPATWQSYDRLLRCHVLPALGGFRLRELARRRIKALLTGMRQAGYAGNTVRLVKAALSTMLTDAADDDLLEANPVLQLGRTKKRRAGLLRPAERQQRIRPMTWTQLDAFLTALTAEPPRTAALLELAVKTGLRPGELGVLRIEDVDLRERTIRVERSWSRPDARIKPTKTYELRTVELSAGLARTLPSPR